MSMLQDFITNLQNKPDHIKNRIFWSTSTIAAVFVVSVWFINFKHQVQNISGGSVLNLGSQTSNAAAPHYTKIDRTEIKNGKLLIFFTVINDTSDILNFSAASDIKLNGTAPSQITDRQGLAFVKKVLSHTENQGTLSFDDTSAKSGSVTFDNLYFEQSPDVIFSETIQF
ncbi:MAG: hypothetical protein KW788_02810 [Candidatus Doudnabacteria bacterium]|nr:hypothetical protein [Candidatus Doudnabacteria bacterium]